MSLVINVDKPDDKKIGIIYLLKMCDTSNKCIYKVGRTINFDNRLKNYNYCDILTLIRSNNIVEDEKQIINKFNKECKLDKGNEFFTHADENFVMSLFMNYFNNKHQKLNIKMYYSSNEIEYKTYKDSLLGNNLPNRSDPTCEFYYLTDSQVKKFLKIKQYGLNLKIDSDHVKNMMNELLNNDKPHFFGHIAIIEYNDYKSDTIDNLIELIDGHHRIDCLKKIYELKPDFKISLWVGLHKSDNPNSLLTHSIFKKYNLLKPFIIDVDISEVSGKIINEINSKFNNGIFTLIKDSEYVCRPSIKKTTINTMIQQKLEKLYKATKIKYKDVNIQKIIDKFLEHNTLFSTKDFLWFNNDLNFKNKKPISQKMLTDAIQYKCYLALVDVKVLIDKCIC